MIYQRLFMAEVIFAVIIMGCFCPLNAADKVGYIDLNRLVKESGMGETARQEIEDLRQKKEKMALEKLQAIKQLKSDLNEKSDLLTEDKKNKFHQLQSLNKDYKRFIDDSKEELTQKDRDLVTTILKNAEEIIKSVAKKDRYTLIIKDPNVLGYMDPKVDITEDVLRKLNAQVKNR